MEKSIEKHIIEVAPLTRIPLNRNQSFSYLSKKTISSGSLVSIPFFRRTVEGVVLSHQPDFARLGNVELKNIASVLEEDFLDKNQLALADFISNHYFSPLGITLKSFVPKRVGTRVRKTEKSTPSPTQRQISGIILTEAQKKAIQIISKKQASKTDSLEYLLLGPAGAGKTEVYIEAIKKLEKNEQALILLPELTLTPQAIERYGQYFSASEIAVFTSKLSKGEYYAQWKKVKSGDIRIIIGTRMAVFAPFKKLGLIVIDEEHDISHKQWEMTPRYDARQVAEKLSALHHAKIIFGSATPSLEIYQQTLDRKAVLIELPHLEIPGQEKKNFHKPLVEIVDMKKERWKSGFHGKIINASSLSRKLQNEISYALRNRTQAILFINRQGMSSFSLCTNCKTVLRCPQCDKALIYDKSGIYRCTSCSFKTSITARCEQCGGIEFKNIGLGTQKIEREINILFPGAKTARLDNETSKIPKFQEKIYADFSENKIDILIGTQMITKGWDLPNVTLIGIIDADNMLSIPDFSTNLRAFQNIVQVAGRSNRPHSKWRGSVIVQTFNPQQEIFKFIAEGDLRSFYEKEASERKELRFPPFGRIIKLIFQDYDKKKVMDETAKLFDTLQLVPDDSTANISEPQDCYVANVRGRFRRQIIIKLKDGLIHPEIAMIIRSLPAGWLIDVDPISII